MTNFKGQYITKDDVKIAKNTFRRLNCNTLHLLGSPLGEFAEFQALEQNPMTMRDWVAELDNRILHNKRKLFKNKSGKISHAQAIEKPKKSLYFSAVLYICSVKIGKKTSKL